MFECALAYMEILIETYFIYFRNQDFQDLLHNLCFIFHNIPFISLFIFFCSNNTFFINCAQKFKYEPSHLKVNNMYCNQPLLVSECFSTDLNTRGNIPGLIITYSKQGSHSHASSRYIDSPAKGGSFCMFRCVLRRPGMNARIVIFMCVIVTVSVPFSNAHKCNLITTSQDTGFRVNL